jgi:hypothetical protein
MSASESPRLPSGWQSSENALGGVDLRVADPRNLRRQFGVVVAVLAVVAGWRTFVNWQMGQKESALVCLGITVLLGLFAIWCAFVDERWHIERNYLEHRISIGRFAYSSRYRDAELEIVFRFVNRRRTYRLYVIAHGSSHFLIERDEAALHQLAGFISFHTGWPVRPLANPPFLAAAMQLAEEIAGQDREGKAKRDISTG